jgi:hypothetical protein
MAVGFLHSFITVINQHMQSAVDLVTVIAVPDPISGWNAAGFQN